MKVYHFSTYEGPAAAATRIHIALLKNAVNSTMVTLRADGDVPNVKEIRPWQFEKIVNRSKNLFFGLRRRLDNTDREVLFSNGNDGFDIMPKITIEKDDIFHLHWICGLISIETYQYLINSGRRVVIHLHDNWFLTGGCHVRMGCEQFSDGCLDCPLFKHRYLKKIASKNIECKTIRNAEHVVVVTPSEWMSNNAKRSITLHNLPIYTVPNPLCADSFRVMNKKDCRKKYGIKDSEFVISFGAADPFTYYKGFNYLLEALKKIRKIKNARKIKILVFGTTKDTFIYELGFEVVFLGFILDPNKLAEVYNASDIFVVPSLEDSFNQTVVEAYYCGTPVVSFATGGIVDNIRHKETGYLARYKDSGDLANGITWFMGMDMDMRRSIGDRGKNLLCSKCSEENVAKRLEAIYKSI